MEEFHGNSGSGSAFTGKLLYGWNTINTNVWLPSLIELVGFRSDKYYEPRGCYYSAMLGLNTANDYFTDVQGGTQFAYFQQYNASGGGEAIWNACAQEQTWLRSTAPDNAIAAWFTNLTANRFDWSGVTATLAVHPAGGTI